jgi:anthranilate synthase
MSKEVTETFTTAGGVSVTRERRAVNYETAISSYVDRLDRRRGAIFSSNYEYPGRYSRWDTAIIDPPLAVASRGREMRIEALNERGKLLLAAIADGLEGHEDIVSLTRSEEKVGITVREPDRVYTEEERSRMPTVFSVLRSIVDLFRCDDEALGLYGAFGYDLAYQFDPVEQHIERPEDQRDMVLYLPDEVVVVDHYSVEAWLDSYHFTIDGKSTADMAGGGAEEDFRRAAIDPPAGDHQPGEYAELVREAKKSFVRGDLFEVVPGQVFYEKCERRPSEIFARLKEINPSPYSFFINLGEEEYLVGASPEMFVRVTGRRVETCPISGTIKRGEDPIADSEQILKLLNSKKDESELTMCSDVDRNDKSRVCEPGSVRVIGRRQIEMYSRLIHTVDHIEGRLRGDMDAFDAFLTHAWAVTVTGAPKLWAMRFIEKHERSPRAWYGGAIGMMHFNGDMNTGLTLRTVRIHKGVAQVRAGATLLNDSIPEEEEKETELKASAMRAAIRKGSNSEGMSVTRPARKVGEGRRILLVDHEDSFVHTLANYFRQTGATVITMRTPVDAATIDRIAPDLAVLSPGPGSPKDFNTAATIKLLRDKRLPVFGVCLGLQAITEYYGGSLAQLDDPMHGKPSRIKVTEPGTVFDGLPKDLTIGRYHSLYADRDKLPASLKVTSLTQDGVIMGIEHVAEPVAAVQFHPESIMSLSHDAGMRMIENVVALLGRADGERGAA